MPAVEVHNLCCPKCLEAGVESALKSRQGTFGYSCDGGHVFNDTEQLQAMNLKPLKVPPPKPAKMPGAGYIKFDISIPETLRNALDARFKDRRDATIAAVLSVICQDGTFIIGAHDAQKLQEVLGEKVRDSAHLSGILFNLKRELSEAQEQSQKVKTAGNSGNSIAHTTAILEGKTVLDLDSGTRAKLEDRARFRGQTVEAVLQDVVVFGLENNWF